MNQVAVRLSSRQCSSWLLRLRHLQAMRAMSNIGFMVIDHLFLYSKGTTTCFGVWNDETTCFPLRDSKVNFYSRAKNDCARLVALRGRVLFALGYTLVDVATSHRKMEMQVCYWGMRNREVLDMGRSEIKGVYLQTPTSISIRWNTEELWTHTYGLLQYLPTFEWMARDSVKWWGPDSWSSRPV